MPRFLMVVHIAVSSGCWHRLFEAKVALGQVETILSSTPSVTRNTTSCGVSPAALLPSPGAGMMPLRVVSAPAIFVPLSVLQLLLTLTQFWYATAISEML